ncbi:MAG: hypothetical protein IJN50_04355 [Clostridia bacterium]|nr:hypothetical protein [Clostridia bacterium]
MPSLVCRKCGAAGKIMKISRYSRKSIVTICCTNCDKTWYLSAGPSCTENDLIRSSKKEVYGGEKPEETAMSIAFAKAFEKQKEEDS